jgi:hypothetical protein
MSSFQVVVREMTQHIILSMYLYHHCGKVKGMAVHAVDQTIRYEDSAQLYCIYEYIESAVSIVLYA